MRHVSLPHTGGAAQNCTYDIMNDSSTQNCIYMEIHVHSTLAFRKEKKEGKVTHQTIAQTNKDLCMLRTVYTNEAYVQTETIT